MKQCGRVHVADGKKHRDKGMFGKEKQEENNSNKTGSGHARKQHKDCRLGLFGLFYLAVLGHIKNTVVVFLFGRSRAKKIYIHLVPSIWPFSCIYKINLVPFIWPFLGI